MQEIKIYPHQLIKVNPEAESDYHKLYEDSGAKYYDEGEAL